MSSSSNNNVSPPFSILDELPLDFGIGFNNARQDQPVAAYPNPSALESSNAQINEKLHNLLFKGLKQSVADLTSELKSQSFEKPKPYTRRPFILTDAPEATRRSRGPTTQAGQLNAVRFKLPEGFDWAALGVEKLVPREANQNPNTQTDRKFSFFQRLEGWSIERKWRSNGKNSDMYYRQKGAKLAFRSIVEVVRYIMYEEEPAKKKGKEHKQGEDGSEIKRSRKWNLNHDSRVIRKSHPTNMEIGGPSHVMNCDDFTIDNVEMNGDDERYCFHHNAPDQEVRANARFTTDDGPMVADGQSSYLDDEMYAIIGDLNPHWVDENLMLPEC